MVEPRLLVAFKVYPAFTGPVTHTRAREAKSPFHPGFAAFDPSGCIRPPFAGHSLAALAARGTVSVGSTWLSRRERRPLPKLVFHLPMLQANLPSKAEPSGCAMIEQDGDHRHTGTKDHEPHPTR
jgi:hypothetical protein